MTLCRTVCALLKSEPIRKASPYGLTWGPTYPESLDRQQIKQVVLNFCLNGIDAMVGKNGVLNVTTRQICGPEIKSIQVEVTNSRLWYRPE